MAMDYTSTRCKFSEDPSWLKLKSDIESFCAKLSKPEEVHYIPDPVLADEYEAQMQEWSELQELQDCQTTSLGILSDTASSPSVGVFEDVHPISSPPAILVDSEFVLVDFDIIWSDFCDAHYSQQFQSCDTMMASVSCFVVLVFFLLRHYKIRGRIFSKWGRLTGTEIDDVSGTRDVAERMTETEVGSANKARLVTTGCTDTRDPSSCEVGRTNIADEKNNNNPIAKTFREKGIPCDVIWMDIDYMDGFRCFTFDKERFPDPESLFRDLHAIGFNAVWMLDPGIKHEPGYFVYDSGCENDVWILKEDGKPFIGEVWPGPCVFPDYTRQQTRSWWAKLVKDFVSNGVDGIWNDMNEPAVFKVVTKTMPENNIHRGDKELGGRQNHFHYHNVYGMLMARSTYEGMKIASGERRPFVLTRAGFIGSQRYAATWTGDNLSNWEHLHTSIPMVLQLSLSGQPLSGPDIGGFAGNASPRLFGRWMGLGALFPFCRGHSETDTIDHEPWSFGKECEDVCRLALLRRYRFIPHIYTLFYAAHTRGSPVVAPTFFADSKDPRLRFVENSFLMGPLLVCASTDPDKGSNELQFVLPRGIWLRFDFGDAHPDLPNLYLQGGSIIPMGPPVQHIGETKPTDELFLLIALDEKGRAEGVLFEDDGDGYGFTQGAYLLTYYVAELCSSIVTVKVSRTEGSFRRPERALNVQLLLGEGAMIHARGIDGEDLKIAMPSETEVSNLIETSRKQYKMFIENAKRIPELDVSGKKGVELSKTPVELKSGEWALKVIPWVGGRMISMMHLPSGYQWLHSRVELDGYEEYSGVEYRSAGCSEEYTVISRCLEESGEEESISMEGNISGGLVIERKISIPRGEPKVFRINSAIVARSVGAGSGGFSRLVCLRVHPSFTLVHPTEVYISFVSIDGSKHEIWPESGEKHLEGNLRPNGEWMLVDRCAGLALINRFDVGQVNKCLIHWGTGIVNLELWSEERPVSKDTPLCVSHEYEVKPVV